MNELKLPCEVGDVSDGFHTFNELYAHRHALFCALANTRPNWSWRSKLHSDGTMMEGWFIAGMKLSSGQISYHLPNEYWDNLEEICTLDNAPDWDGHTPTDVIDRLLEWGGLGT
jgi:hypothetical protein